MYIINSDLQFLIGLENKLGIQEGWSEDVSRLWELIERMKNQADKTRAYTREHYRKMRMIDKNYGRGKQHEQQE